MTAEGSFGIKLPTIWTGARAKVGRVREENVEDQSARKVEKSRITVFSNNWWLPMVQKIKRLHAVVAQSTFRSQNAKSTSDPSHLWELRSGKKRTPLWGEAHFKLKIRKTLQFRATFGS